MTKAIDVAFVLPSFAGGGAKRVILTIIAHLNRNRFDPRLIALTGEGPLAPLVAGDVEVIDLRRPRLRQAWPALRRALKVDPPQIVFSTMAYLNQGVLALKPYLPSSIRS